MVKQNIGFVGAGQMASALAAGFVRKRLVDGGQITAADPTPAAAEAFQRAVPGARILSDNAAVAKAADVLVIATKPQHLAGAVAHLADPAADKLVISIAAGITLCMLDAALPKLRLVRVMPNTPCLVGQSASGYALGPCARRPMVCWWPNCWSRSGVRSPSTNSYSTP